MQVLSSLVLSSPVWSCGGDLPKSVCRCWETVCRRKAFGRPVVVPRRLTRRVVATFREVFVGAGRPFVQFDARPLGVLSLFPDG